MTHSRVWLLFSRSFTFVPILISAISMLNTLGREDQWSRSSGGITLNAIYVVARIKVPHTIFFVRLASARSESRGVYHFKRDDVPPARACVRVSL